MTREMTRDEALQEARRRWGSAAVAYISPYQYHVVAPSSAYPIIMRFAGKTWESAFAEADKADAL